MAEFDAVEVSVSVSVVVARADGSSERFVWEDTRSDLFGDPSPVTAARVLVADLAYRVNRQLARLYSGA